MAKSKSKSENQVVSNNAVVSDSLIEKLVSVRRTAKVVKGGRIFGFSAIVVIGDGKGRLGVGYGKSREVSQAISKATEGAKRNMRKVILNGTTIYHKVIGTHGATKVVMLPASSGTGVIAGGSVRAICEVMGIRDVLTKCIGSRSPVNVVRAVISALEQLVTPESIAAKRGLSLVEIAR